MTERIRDPRVYSLQILTDDDNHLLQGGSGFTVRYPFVQEEFVTDLNGDRFQIHGRQHSGNLFVSFNEHYSDVLRVSRVLEEMMYGHRGHFSPPPCTLLVHNEGSPTCTLRDCTMSSVQFGASTDIMSIECDWTFRECDFRGGIPTEERWAALSPEEEATHAYFAALGRREQPERINWQTEGF